MYIRWSFKWFSIPAKRDVATNSWKMWQKPENAFAIVIWNYINSTPIPPPPQPTFLLSFFTSVCIHILRYIHSYWRPQMNIVGGRFANWKFFHLCCALALSLSRAFRLSFLVYVLRCDAAAAAEWKYIKRQKSFTRSRRGWKREKPFFIGWFP